MISFNRNSELWEGIENYYHDEKIELKQQKEKGTCVATSLAMLTGKEPANFIGNINTQNPNSWSDALKPYRKQLVYCPTDIRKLKFYLDELLQLNDLFLLSYYLPEKAEDLLKDPDEKGWLSRSHVVVLHKQMILDSKLTKPVDAKSHSCIEKHTKRIFRVTPFN